MIFFLISQIWVDITNVAKFNTRERGGSRRVAKYPKILDKYK